MAALELFEFLREGTYYRYTSGSVTVVKDAQNFMAKPIRRGTIANSDDLNRAGLSITAMRDNPYVVAALSSSQPGSITIYGELTDSTWATIWKGRIISMFLHGAEAEIETESLLTALNRVALYSKYQIICRHVLYDEGCRLVASTYKYTGTVSNIDGVTITVPGLNGQSDGYYTAGYVKFGSYDYRMITNHVGNVITIYSLVPGLAVDDPADVYPGCDHSETICETKYSNLLNYGGFPWIPAGRNPFTVVGPKKRRR